MRVRFLGSAFGSILAFDSSLGIGLANGAGSTVEGGAGGGSTGRRRRKIGRRRKICASAADVVATMLANKAILATNTKRSVHMIDSFREMCSLGGRVLEMLLKRSRPQRPDAHEAIGVA